MSTPACGKRRYTSRRQALANLLATTRKTGTPLRMYRCPNCGGWHLTKKPRGKAAKR